MKTKYGKQPICQAARDGSLEDVKYLVDRLKVFLPTINIRYTSVNQYPFLRGLNAHYHVMSEQDYKSTL